MGRGHDFDRPWNVDDVLAHRPGVGAPYDRHSSRQFKRDELMQQPSHDLRGWEDISADQKAIANGGREDRLPRPLHNVNHQADVERVGADQLSSPLLPFPRLQSMIRGFLLFRAWGRRSPSNSTRPRDRSVLIRRLLPHLPKIAQTIDILDNRRIVEGPSVTSVRVSQDRAPRLSVGSALNTTA